MVDAIAMLPLSIPQTANYGDYVEQLTYLLFLKMAHERTQPPWNEASRIPSGLDWPSLVGKSGSDLEAHYWKILQTLASQTGLLGLIFRKSQNRIQDPAKLRRLIVNVIEPEMWTAIDADVKGDVYEGLLEKNAADTKSGAGQYFTPRALINAIVDVMQPAPGMTIADPACGTGGFLLAAHDYIVRHHGLDRDQKKFLRDKAFHGVELVDNTARLCAMNLFLHGIGGASVDAEPTIEGGRDALAHEPTDHVDMVLANPPFGSQSSITLIGADGKAAKDEIAISRDDFWATTSNKQFNFVQHIRSMLKIGGRAAVVLPDNVLYEEGDAPETIRRRLFHECDVHTILRLPAGIFYRPGVRANVLFFDRHAGSLTPSTQETWVYDFRTNQHFTLKNHPLKRADLDDFVAAFKPGARKRREESERFRRWTYEDLNARPNFNLDVGAYVKDEAVQDATTLLAPEVIAEEIVTNLAAALERFSAVATELGGNGEEADTVDVVFGADDV